MIKGQRQSLFGKTIYALEGADRTDEIRSVELRAHGFSNMPLMPSSELMVDASGYAEADIKRAIGLLVQEGRTARQIGANLVVSRRADPEQAAKAARDLAISLQQQQLCAVEVGTH